jgi:hypothetical protein
MHKRPQDSKIVICGTARNVQSKLVPFIRKMSKSFSPFKEVHFFIVESFSEDETVNLLKNISQKNSKIRYKVDSKISLSEKRRTVRIASARNLIISEVKNFYIDFDYVVMADMDGVNRDLSVRSVTSCWNYHDWDAMFANQPFCYYDIWALRAIGWCESDCWKVYHSLISNMDKKAATKLAVTDKMRSIKRESVLIPVNSAFGGLGIYKKSVFVESAYVGEYPDGQECCEHVPFNTLLSEKGFRLFINPNLVNIKPSTQIMTKTKDVLRSSLTRN